MTALYNVLERVRELESGCEVPALTPKERDIHEAGLVSVLKEIHDDIDRAVFEAYGWVDLAPALVGRPARRRPRRTRRRNRRKRRRNCSPASSR